MLSSIKNLTLFDFIINKKITENIRPIDPINYKLTIEEITKNAYEIFSDDYTFILLIENTCYSDYGYVQWCSENRNATEDYLNVMIYKNKLNNPIDNSYNCYLKLTTDNDIHWELSIFQFNKVPKEFIEFIRNFIQDHDYSKDKNFINISSEDLRNEYISRMKELHIHNFNNDVCTLCGKHNNCYNCEEKKWELNCEKCRMNFCIDCMVCYKSTLKCVNCLNRMNI
jgi:hypothetical protein